MRRAMLLLGSIVALIAAPPALADNGLVGWWPFDAGSGTVARDASGHGNDGTLSGGAQWTTGYFGSAVSFDGGTARVQVEDGSSLEPTAQVSVAAWVRAPQPQGNYKYIVAKGASACLAASYGLYTGANGGLRFYTSKNQGLSYTVSPDAGTGVWDGNWHFVVGTYDGSAVRLYVDGKQVGSGTPLSGAIDYKFPENDLFIGHYNGCRGLDFKGTIDEPQVWSRALSASEISTSYPTLVALHNCGPATPPSPFPLPLKPAPASPSPSSHPSPAPAGSVGFGVFKVSKVSFSGLAAGKLRLAFTLTGGASATPIKSFTLALPRGLRFARSLKQLRTGVNTSHVGRYSVALSRGKLLVVLNHASRKLVVTIRTPALTEAPALIGHVKAIERFNGTRKHAKVQHRSKKTLSLKIVMRLTNTAHRRASVGIIHKVS